MVGGVMAGGGRDAHWDVDVARLRAQHGEAARRFA